MVKRTELSPVREHLENNGVDPYGLSREIDTLVTYIEKLESRLSEMEKQNK